MSEPNQRLIAWQVKTDIGRVRETLDSLRPDMLRHYEAAVAGLCETETKARRTLNAAGMHTIMRVPYLSHARQLYELSRQQGISDESFALGPMSCSTNEPPAARHQPYSRQSASESSTSPPRHRGRSRPPNGGERTGEGNGRSP